MENKKGKNLIDYMKKHGPWNKGKKMSSDLRKKLSDAHKLSFKNGRKHPMLGKKHSEETKAHWRIIRKGVDFRSKETIEKIKNEWSSRKGSDVKTWKGGVTSIYRTVRTMPEYYFWRNAVFQRDNYTCIWCGQRGGMLNADHIIPFSIIIEIESITDRWMAKKSNALWDIENGRTLCVDCHKASPSLNTRREYVKKCMADKKAYKLDRKLAIIALKQELKKLK